MKQERGQHRGNEEITASGGLGGTGRRRKRLSMCRFISTSHPQHLALLLKRKPVMAAVAFVSDSTKLRLGRGDLLICDASNAAARAGATRRDTLDTLLRRGVQIWSREHLHAKVVVAGDRVLVGSGNWSNRSASVLIEAGIEATDEALVSEAANFVRSLARHPSIRVTREFLAQMPEPEILSPSNAGARDDDDRPARHWLISLAPLKTLREPMRRMETAVERDRKRIAATGVSKAKLETFLWQGRTGPGPRIRVEDTVTVLWRDERRAVTVYPPCEVLKVRKSEGVTGVLYLTPSRYESRRITFRRFLLLAKRVGLPARIKETSNRELTEAQFEAMTAAWPAARRRR